MSTPIETVSSRIAYETPWLRIREDEIRYTATGSSGLYSYIEKRDFALVIPAEKEGFWLVEQYRYTIGRRQWEFPQGGWPASKGGTPAELAAAELREETGITAASWSHLSHQYAAYGYSSQGYDIYLASDLTHGAPEREPTEADMRHQWFSEAEVRAMIGNGTLADAHSVAAWAVLDLSRDGQSDRRPA
ncbi:MAG: hypothetical protein QOH56_4468 [Pseudonocardiales bacterium]|jgi:8-oxo-dGTP pyrophosphatase MutT (NUDIX family)|nr:hypothetical protein [Pseudonocardiales bacterium]